MVAIINLTWVPSQEALDAGIVPEDHTIYDISTGPLTSETMDAGELEKLCASIEAQAVPKYRHQLNNETATAWINAKTRKEDPIEDTTENRAAFLHNHRTKIMNAVLDGRLGLKRGGSTSPRDSFTIEREIAVVAILRGYAVQKGKSFPSGTPDGRPNKAMLESVYLDTKQTIKEVMDAFLAPESNWKATIDATARESLAKKAAEKAKAEKVAESVSSLDELMAGPPKATDEDPMPGTESLDINPPPAA